MPNPLHARLRSLLEVSGGLFTVEDERIVIDVGGGRRQTVAVETEGERIRFRSVVARGGDLLDEHGARRSEADLLPTLWQQNAQCDTVSFSLDRYGRVVGYAEAFLPTLDPEEAQFYILRLAEACDRLEFVLTGRDVE